MKYYQIIFSPTGGTEKAADLFTKHLTKEVAAIDLCNPKIDTSRYGFTPADVCIVAVPSYGGRVPAIAADRLSRLRGNGAKAILIATYGNRAYEDTLLELQEIMQGAGFDCIAAMALVTEHAIMHQYGADRPDGTDQREIADFAKVVEEKLRRDAGEAGRKNHLSLPGNSPYRTYDGVPMKPVAVKACVGCGKCAATCPVGAIPKDRPSFTEKDKCISCMRCMAVCPKKGRKVSNILLFVGGQKMKGVCSTRKGNELFL